MSVEIGNDGAGLMLGEGGEPLLLGHGCDSLPSVSKLLFDHVAVTCVDKAMLRPCATCRKQRCIEPSSMSSAAVSWPKKDGI